jgi:hypothetical protein
MAGTRLYIRLICARQKEHNDSQATLYRICRLAFSAASGQIGSVLAVMPFALLSLIARDAFPQDHAARRYPIPMQACCRSGWEQTCQVSLRGGVGDQFDDNRAAQFLFECDLVALDAPKFKLTVASSMNG